MIRGHVSSLDEFRRVTAVLLGGPVVVPEPRRPPARCSGGDGKYRPRIHRLSMPEGPSLTREWSDEEYISHLLTGV